MLDIAKRLLSVSYIIHYLGFHELEACSRKLDFLEKLVL
jgi:hypothetical protein